MKFVLSTIALLILATALCAGEKRSKWQWATTNSGWQWATTPAKASPCSTACVCGCNANGTCTCTTTIPAPVAKASEPVASCANGSCSTGSCANGSCSAPTRSRRGR